MTNTGRTERVGFKEKTIGSVMEQVWTSPQTKFQKDAMCATKVLVELLVEEALLRAAAEAKKDPEVRRLDVEHLERITPQLLLDM